MLAHPSLSTSGSRRLVMAPAHDRHLGGVPSCPRVCTTLKEEGLPRGEATRERARVSGAAGDVAPVWDHLTYEQKNGRLTRRRHGWCGTLVLFAERGRRGTARLPAGRALGIARGEGQGSIPAFASLRGRRIGWGGPRRDHRQVDGTKNRIIQVVHR